MDRISSLLLLIISLSSFLLFANAFTRNSLHVVSHNAGAGAGAPTNSPSLLDFCKDLTNPDLCKQTIGPHFGYLSTKNAIEPSKALLIAVDATLAQTKKTLDVMRGLLEKEGISKDLKDSINSCKTQYSSILDSINDTKEALKTNNLIEAKSKFSAVISFQSSCKDEFEGSDDFPFASDSDAVFQLGGNCLDIIAAIQNSLPPQAVPIVQSPPSPYSNVIGTLP